MSGPQRPVLQRLRRFKTRIRQRKFLEHYARYGSMEVAADLAGVSARHAYRWKRNNPWFRRRCELAAVAYLDRVEGTIVLKGVDQMDLAALTFVARHRIAAYRPEPKVTKAPALPAVTMNDYSSNTNISVGHFTDEELETYHRLMLKAGIPQALIDAQAQPPEPIDVQGQTAPVEAKP